MNRRLLLCTLALFGIITLGVFAAIEYKETGKRREVARNVPLSGPELKKAEVSAEHEYRADGLPWVAEEAPGYHLLKKNEKKFQNIFPNPSGAKDKAFNKFLQNDYSQIDSASQETLASYKAELEQQARILRTKSIYFGNDRNEGFQGFVQDLQPLKFYAKLFSVRAMAEAKKGNAEASLRDFRAANDLRKVLQTQPSVIGCLVDIAIVHIIGRRLSYAVSDLTNAGKDTSSLIALLPEMHINPGLLQIYRSEMFDDLILCRNWKLREAKLPVSIMSGWPENEKSANYELNNLKYWNAVFKEVGGRWSDWEAVSRALSAARRIVPPLKSQGNDYDENLAPESFDITGPLREEKRLATLQDLYFSAASYLRRHGSPPKSLTLIASQNQMPVAKVFTIQKHGKGFTISGTRDVGAYKQPLQRSFPPAKNDRW